MHNAREREILLAHVLKVTREYLYLYPEKKNNLTKQEQETLAALINRQEKGEPIAYLTGSREFFSLRFKVTPDTLIPRHETELLVETVLEKFNQDNLVVLELGTGSGAVAISIASQRKNWQIDAVELSEKALIIARENALIHQTGNICFIFSNWFENIQNKKYNLIVSNPPYIAEHDPHLQQDGLWFEPELALISGQEGLDALVSIIKKAPEFLVNKGCLLVEHGFSQSLQVQALMQQQGFDRIETLPDLSGLPRVTKGEWNENVAQNR